MRFDDSLTTVLSGDTDTGAGASATWRQLLDLLGRGRIPAEDDLLARLRALRSAVPTEVRAASARALAFAQPDAALVAFVAEDGLAIAAPLLRTAALDGEAWAGLIPRLGPTGRSVLRGRRDLPIEAIRSLESFGPTDLALPYEVQTLDRDEADQLPDGPLSSTAFAPLGEVARSIPVVAEALHQAEQAETAPSSQIADLVARIDAFRQDHAASRDTEPSAQPDSLRFVADAEGIIRSATGEARSLLIGASLALAGRQGQVAFDAAAVPVVRRRRVENGRLTIGGASPAAGRWHVVASPTFDRVSGRFTGYRGTARRLAALPPRSGAADSLRQLVHELRTPSNAIVGFAELIDMQLLGTVPEHYRERATAIRTQAGDFLAAIDDLDWMARLESGALEVREGIVPVLPLLRRLVNDVQPLARSRGVGLRLAADSGYREAAADDRLVERMLDRLLHLLLQAAATGDALTVAVKQGSKSVKIVADTPASFSLSPAEPSDAPHVAGDRLLLGAAFTAALVVRLVAELRGSLSMRAGRLTLRLPLASDQPVHGAPDQLR